MDTKKMRDISREQFEAWIRKEYQLDASDDINFANGEVRMMLKGWQASREALVVELPATGTLLVSGWNQAVHRCREAIAAHGLKVRP